MISLRRCFIATAVASLFLLLAPSAPAQDRIFNYTYQSLVLSPGQREIEVWNTLRWGREQFYRALDQRLEFELGLAPHLQTSFYLNVGSRSASSVAPQYTVSRTGQVQATATPVIANSTEWSFSNEWKYKLLDPVADPVGFALYGELSVSSNEYELEPRIILDKVLGGALIAFNAASEIGFEKQVGDDGVETTEKEYALEFELAAGFHVAEGIYLGLESVSQNGFDGGSIAYSALYAGPTLSYAQDKFWVNLSILPQVIALKGATQNGLVLDEAERFQTRLLFSYAL